MRHMVMKAQLVVHYGVVDVISFYEVFECSRSLLGCGFDFVDGNRGEVDRLC